MCDVHLSDERLAEKFKREYNEQFHILVRMHLSFLLDLNTDENECFSDKQKLKKWSIVPFNKKNKNKGPMEGAPLTQEGICQVYQLIEFLKKEENIKVEGIFRRTGSLTRQQELRNLLNQGITLELESSNYSVHDCASVLKGFLAELSDPLLTEAHYPAYWQIAELCGVTEKAMQEEKLLVALQLILLLLPTENKVLLRDILDLLHLTASYESFNRMSADNLAKLFTPHLLCPRKLTPEQLHINSQNLSGIVSFMILRSAEIFKIPQKLIVDFRCRLGKKTLLNLNESVSDQFAANTVFTFVDQERTAKENEINTTETALAQLYAHIQSLPESSKKRKLVKQFNKENGNGTPLQVLRSGMQKNKSFGDSIKKHIFHKSMAKTLRKAQILGNSEENVHTPLNSTTPVSKSRLFCANCETSPDVSNTESAPKRRRTKSPRTSTDMKTPTSYVTSTPACRPLIQCPEMSFTPDGQDRKSMSPITRSTQRMTRAMQETMMTPRSRKPVLLVSGTNINTLASKADPSRTTMDNLPEEFPNEKISFQECSDGKGSSDEFSNEKLSHEEFSDGKSNSKDSSSSNSSLSETFKDYLETRSIMTTSPAADSSFSSRTDDFNSNEFNDVSESKLSNSLLHCLNGNHPDSLENFCGEKELMLKPKQFDENGLPIVFETSF